MTVGPPLLSTDGTIAKAWATMVIPMKITPSRRAIVIIVLAAFFASGGLNAGTPLAIASTPVSATEPPANARRSRNSMIAWAPRGTASGWCGNAVDGPGHDPGQPDDHDQEGERDEQVGGDGEDVARFAQAAEVADRDQGDRRPRSGSHPVIV